MQDLRLQMQGSTSGLRPPPQGVEGSSTDVVHTEALLYTPYVYMYHASICIKKRA